MNDDVKSTVIKVAAMLLLVAAEWWAMQPYHEPLLAGIYEKMAKLFYKLAHMCGSLGLNFEAKYYEAQS
jgi:hypothetical protein